MTAQPLLHADGVSVSFGGKRVLSDVTVEAETGRVTGLIGPNGAGKTTLFNVITGLQRPAAGRVILDGNDVSGLDTCQRARLGIARTFQRLELFTDLSVRDNLRVAGDIRNSWRRIGRHSARKDAARDVDRVLELVGLTPLADVPVSDVPTGIGRIVELGRALMIRPRALLLDEPAAGQTDEETKAFEALIRRLADEDDLAVLLVEHDIELVMGVCDRIYVLDFGEVISVGTPAAVRADARVRDAYLGATP